MRPRLRNGGLVDVMKGTRIDDISGYRGLAAGRVVHGIKIVESVIIVAADDALSGETAHHFRVVDGGETE